MINKEKIPSFNELPPHPIIASAMRRVGFGYRLNPDGSIKSDEQMELERKELAEKSDGR